MRHWFGSFRIRLTVLFGGLDIALYVAQAAPDDASEDDAVNLADRHLYRAKAEGRNRVAAADRLPGAALAS